MELKENKTTFEHIVWGKGILRGQSETKFKIEFENGETLSVPRTALDGGFLAVIGNVEDTSDCKTESSLESTEEAPLLPEKSEEKAENLKVAESKSLHETLHPQYPTPAGNQNVSLDIPLEKGQEEIISTEPTYVKTNKGVLRQYDTSNLVVGNENILEAFESDDVAMFNESYTLIGDETHAKKISAAYNLTVLGNLRADEILVNGELTVTGDLTVGRLDCRGNLVCKGDILADEVQIGGDVIANSIHCKEFSCDGNVFARNSIDTDEKCEVANLLVACEGILGAGEFTVANAIANEYFEFSGSVNGNVQELDADEQTKSTAASNDSGKQDITIEEQIEHLLSALVEKFGKTNTENETYLYELIDKFASDEWKMLPFSGDILDQVTRVSQKKSVDNLYDYLIAKYAALTLPERFKGMKLMQRINRELLPAAEENLAALQYTPESVEKFANTLVMAVKCQNEYPVSAEIVFDIIFSAVGLKYSTVEYALNRNAC